MRSETRHISLCAVVVLTLLTSSVTYADNIYVSGWNSGKIYKFDSSGNRSIFASGYSAECLAFDKSGNLYASSGGMIEKYDSSGNASAFAYDLGGPVALAFDSSDNLYAAGWNSGKIYKLDSSGNRSIFASGYSAECLAFDSSGNLYASSGGMIEKYDSSGNASAFAYDLGGPCHIATQIPEPATLLLLGLGGVIIRKKR